MKAAQFIFPHQLFKETSWLDKTIPVLMIEEVLFFQQFNFHKQKLVFHRATMKFYEAFLLELGFDVQYIEYGSPLSDIRQLIPDLIGKGLQELHVMNPTDNWMEGRIAAYKSEIRIRESENLLFLNSKVSLKDFFKSEKKNFFQTSFYKQQRVQRNIMMVDGQPKGGKWSFDDENRKKFPSNKAIPQIKFPEEDEFFREAKTYVELHFQENPGTLDQKYYPNTYEEAEAWLADFFEQRFYDFGSYEDALVKSAHFLNHSVLSPLMNVGLLQPEEVIEKAVHFAEQNEIPINSLEGFVRQILGWREFIRGVYEVKGSEERTRNFWKHKREIPESFYTGKTGIVPIDETIRKVLKTGYAHHIERLMVLGNFMLLCEFHPNAVYKWFMELFIDAYDWVMVPNVYGMSLFADGGLMSTKPYISSSNYIKKMSDYPKGEWMQIWDGLFWRFMDKNRAFLGKNPRLRMLLSSLDRMDPSKRVQHFEIAEGFLEQLDTANKKSLKNR